MPKALSLKKSNTTKNQKEITNFFKSLPCGQGKKSPHKYQQSAETPTKRKVNSPIKVENLNDRGNDCENPLKKIKKNTVNKLIFEENRSSVHNPSNIPANTKTSPEKIINYSEDMNLIFSNEKGCKSDKSSFLTSISINSIQNNEHINQTSKKQCVSTLKEKEIENNDTKVSNDKNTLYYQNITSPKKNLKASVVHSPKSPRLKTAQTSKNQSPSKYGSTVKILEFTDSLHDVHDGFDEWDLDNIEDNNDDLDLSTMQRCEILTVKRHNYKVELKLQNEKNDKGMCFVEGIWLNTPLQEGEIISILASKNSSGQYSVTNTSGLLSLRPDHLISSTSVVAGVFCKRKAVLQERWRGIDSANTAMTIGILIHELVQKALTQPVTNVSDLCLETDKIIKESIQMLYDAGLTETEARSNMQIYIQPLADFLQTYVVERQNPMRNEKGKWNGKIDKVLDIEENLCCPQLGLKGKIDATVQVTIHEQKQEQTAIVPLELKSGRASVSAEHRGQLVLYGMMLSLQQQKDPAEALQRGLLLYLKERVDLREVSCGYPERRDLVMLRNDLVQHLAAGPQHPDTDNLIDIEDASRLLQQSLPEPVHHHTACSKCPYLTLCSLHLWHTDSCTVSDTHPLAKLREESLGHLSSQHIQYFLHWTSLLKLEEKGQMTASPLHALWTHSVEKRVKRGACAANLKLISVSNSSDRFLHVFGRNINADISENDQPRISSTGPQEGEFSIVSIINRPWIAAGVVTLANTDHIHILLERDLSRRMDKDTLFHIDVYESYASTVQNLTNLGVLMEDSDRASRLRELIIDKAAVEFTPKLPREVGRLGAKLMRALNVEQQRAVLKAIAARHYMLLKGLPGTGKTQTISVLIQMLVALRQRVLVTAHTHSAVDTVLGRLPASVRVMRLGASSRVSPGLLSRCEQSLTRDCRTTEQLTQLYDSMEVVGVTCLGATHPMLARTTFDVCIVDEATQVLQCTVLRPLFAAKRFILVGDPEQLPPVVRSKSARRLGMEQSLFHRLLREEATCALRLQYRMNQALVDVANKVAYSDQLRCADQRVAQDTLRIDMPKVSQHSTESQWLEVACSAEFENAVIFLNTECSVKEQTTNNEKALTNSEEAALVMALVETFKQGDVSPADIGVIAPYRDQVSLLRRALSGAQVEVSTVDQFQGRDKSVIIYSCTKRREKDDRQPKVSELFKEGEVLNDPRRLAVSVTRAKHKLIVLGDKRALQRYTSLLRLIQACKTITLDEHTIANLNIKYKNFIN